MGDSRCRAYLDAAAFDQVQHGEVLGQAQRVVEDGDERGEVDAHRARARQDRRRLDDRRRAVSVIGTVVLGEVHRLEAEPVTPLALDDDRIRAAPRSNPATTHSEIPLDEFGRSLDGEPTPLVNILRNSTRGG